MLRTAIQSKNTESLFKFIIDCFLKLSMAFTMGKRKQNQIFDRIKDGSFRVFRKVIAFHLISTIPLFIFYLEALLPANGLSKHHSRAFIRLLASEL